MGSWIEYRRESGEKIDGNSWLMRQLWNTKEGQYHHGTIKDAVKLKSSGVKRLIEDALWTQGIRKKADLKRNSILATIYSVRITGGGVHVPLRTPSPGRYVRITRLNVFDTEGAGEGSQLDSLSAPGLACCIYISSEPSVLFFNPSVYWPIL